MLRRTLLSIATLSLAACTAVSQDKAPDKPGVSLTVYSAADPATFDPQQYVRMMTLQGPYYRYQNPMPGYGVVRDIRKVKLDANAPLRLTDVAAGIDPTTVRFRSFTDPNASVLEQDFEYDLVSTQALLKKYVDQKVVVERSAGEGKTETIEGTLLSADGGLIVQDNAGAVRIINGYTGVRLADSAKLITRPTLVWDIQTDKPGEHLAEVSYQTDGLTWRADYTLVLNKNDTATDVSSWVTLLNQSGTTYNNATLKLVAGDVQRVKPQQYAREEMQFRDSVRLAEPAAGFTEKSFFEYHLYTLGRQTTVDNNATKQIELFAPRSDVPVEKVFVYYGLPADPRWSFTPSPITDRELGTRSNKKVDIYVRFKNAKEQGLGIPLPAGRVRVYKRDDADGNMEFIGEDVIQHTPKEEEILIRMGSAFDLVGERKQTDYQIDAGRFIIESFEIKLRNRKDVPATIIVKENLFRWLNWEITKSSDKWEKQDSRTIHIPVTLKPGEEKVVTYTVKYTW